MVVWFAQGLEALRDFMLWDGLALLAFGGIIALGLRFYHAKIALVVASCIPLTNIAILVGSKVVGQGFALQPFLMPITMVIMALGAFLALRPIEASS